MKETIVKICLIIGIAGYWIWPIDIIPGLPIDDILITILGITGIHKIGKK